jgi:hypothetical protein
MANDIWSISYRDGSEDIVEITFDALCQFEEKFNKTPLMVSENVFPAALSWVLWRCLADEGRTIETYEVYRKRISDLNKLEEKNTHPTKPAASTKRSSSSRS